MKNILVIAFLVVAGSCIDERQIALPSEPPRIVIDGLISNRVGASYINIGWSAPVNSSCKDAFGNSVTCEPGVFNGPYSVTGLVRIIVNNGEATLEMPFQMNDKQGMIRLNPEIIGIPGHKYSLEVEVDYDGAREYYAASAEMLHTPQITDIAYEIRKGDVGKSDNFVPLISFSDPPGDHFYLLQLCSLDGSYVYCGHSRVWSYSLIADTFLPPNVEGLSVDDGASIAKYAEFYPPAMTGAGAEVRMYSVDRLTYDFYKSLIDQFNNDGGSYSPTPATPKGNISGNGIGLFRAVEESSARVYYP